MKIFTATKLFAADQDIVTFKMLSLDTVRRTVEVWFKNLHLWDESNYFQASFNLFETKSDFSNQNLLYFGFNLLLFQSWKFSEVSPYRLNDWVWTRWNYHKVHGHDEYEWSPKSRCDAENPLAEVINDGEETDEKNKWASGMNSQDVVCKPRIFHVEFESNLGREFCCKTF